MRNYFCQETLFLYNTETYGSEKKKMEFLGAIPYGNTYRAKYRKTFQQ